MILPYAELRFCANVYSINVTSEHGFKRVCTTFIVLSDTNSFHLLPSRYLTVNVEWD